MKPQAAKPIGRGNPTIHYYQPDPDMAGLFVPICNERGHAYKAWHLTFKDHQEEGWSRICPTCQEVAIATNQ